MKKTSLILCLFLLLALALCGCGNKKYEPAFGNWEIQTYAENGIDTDISNCAYPQMSMSDDGNFVFINGENNYEGTYDIDGNNITAELNGQKITMTLINNGSYITVTYTGDDTEYLMVYKKVNS